MTKLVFIALFLFTAVSVFAQKKILNEDLLVSDSLVKLKFITKIFHFDDYYCDGYEGINVDEEFERFLSTYFENFTLIESKQNFYLVFNGRTCSGQESGSVVLYQISDDKVSKVLSKPGKLIAIDSEVIVIHSYPCCSMNTNLINTYSLINGKLIGKSHVFFSYFELHSIKSIELFRREQIPKTRIKLLTNSNLYWDDTIKAPMDYGPPDACDNGNSNKICLLKEFEVGHLLKYNDQRTWAFVQFTNTNAEETYCPVNFEKKLIESDEYYLYGWIKTSDFNIIKTD